MVRKYKNPPIIEALCEFQFGPDSSWDLAMPGLIYEKVKDIFPKRRQVKMLALNIPAVPRAVTVEPQIQAIERMQFLQESERVLVQVGSQLVAVNHLKPYSSWNEFFPLIQKGFSAYCKVIEPKNIHRVELRYINRIEFPVKDAEEFQRIKLEDYFNFYPFVGSNLPQELRSFVMGIEASYERAKDILRLQLTSGSTEAFNTAAIILDIDYFLAKPGEVEIDDVFEWVDLAHKRIEESFENCIKDRLRQIFEEVKE